MSAGHFCLLTGWHPICSNWSCIAFCITRGTSKNIFNTFCVCWFYILCSFLVCDLTAMQIVELIDRYDTNCGPITDKVGYIQDSKTNKSCTRTLTVSMTAKVRFI